MARGRGNPFLTLIGVLLFLAGIAAGVYVGFWLMFIGGFIDIIDAIKMVVSSAPASSASIAWNVACGVLKIMLAGMSAVITFTICTFISGIFFAAGEG